MSFTELENSIRIRLNQYSEELKDTITSGNVLEREQYLLLLGQIRATKDCLDLFERTINDYNYGKVVTERGD
jgi:hypothetical protein